MLGVIIYIYFLTLGFIYSKFIFENKSLSFYLWVGLILGNLLLMVGIVIPAFILGFNMLSHIILIITALIPLLFILKKKGFKDFKNTIITNNNKDDVINKKIMFFAIMPLTLLICILMTNHILVDTRRSEDMQVVNLHLVI